MKFSTVPTATFILASSHCANSLSVTTHLTAGQRNLNTSPVFSSSSSSSLLLSQPANHRKGSLSKLFSASAAISSDGPVNGQNAAGDTEELDFNYGPAITLGKLKINLFGAIFGIWEIFWGVFYWYPAMTLYQLSRKFPGDLIGKIDPFRRIPICVGYIWGMLSMSLFGLWPTVEGRENLEVLREVNKNGKKGKLKPAMYVANHCSWMDIPFVARVFGFLNYKIIAKTELLKVPILGKAIKVAGHVVLDRTNRRSQMQAYKSGIQWLKDGVNLVTFPEGTRSKDSRLSSFKMGAFKMAQTAGASVIPMAITHADKVQPREYAFPAKPCRMRPKSVIKIGKPIETEGKSDSELLEEVWRAIADMLPESQKPSKDTPVGVNN